MEKIQAPEPGLYKDIDFDTYTQWDAVNQSILTAFSRTAAHVQYQLQHGGLDRTPALDLGWYVHLAVLEPERFAELVVVPPKVDRRTKKGKATWTEFEARHTEKILVEADTFVKVKGMAASIREHPTAAEFFRSEGHNEVSVVWDEHEVGIRCKARVDRITQIGEWPLVGDLKTARNASRRLFERSIYDYEYHVQAAHYLAGLEALFPVPAGNPFRRFVFVVVESEPPYLCACYELDDAALEEGERKRQRYLRQWRECLETDQWPGYPDGIEYVSLPAWAFKEYQIDG